MPVVEIYTKAFCPFCWRAKALLEAKGIELSGDLGRFRRPDTRLMIERANGRTTVPQIFIRDRHVGGCDDLFAARPGGQARRLLAA